MYKNIFVNLKKILAFESKNHGAIKKELEYILGKQVISLELERKLVRILQARFQSNPIEAKEKLLIKETLKLLFIAKHQNSLQKLTL